MRTSIFFLLALILAAFLTSRAFADTDAGTPTVTETKPSTVDVPDPSSNPSGFFDKLLGAANWKQKGGVQWKTLLIGLMIGLTFLVRKGAKKISAFWGDDRGGAIIAILVGVFTTIAGVLKTAPNNDVASTGTVIGALLNAGLASGWYVLIKRIVWPQTKATPVS